MITENSSLQSMLSKDQSLLVERRSRVQAMLRKGDHLQKIYYWNRVFRLHWQLQSCFHCFLMQSLLVHPALSHGCHQLAGLSPFRLLPYCAHLGQWQGAELGVFTGTPSLGKGGTGNLESFPHLSWLVGATAWVPLPILQRLETKLSSLL